MVTVCEKHVDKYMKTAGYVCYHCTKLSHPIATHRSDKDVDPEVEFASTDEIGTFNVALYDIRLRAIFGLLDQRLVLCSLATKKTQMI